MTTYILILIECILTIVLFASVALYFRAAKRKKSTAKYGALLDLSAIHIVALPILRAACDCFHNDPGLLHGNILLLVVVIYLGVLSWDLKYLLNAYRQNKPARQVKKQNVRRT